MAILSLRPSIGLRIAFPPGPADPLNDPGVHAKPTANEKQGNQVPLPLKENPLDDQDFLTKPAANEQQGNRVALPLKENPLNDRDFLAKPKQERESLTVGLH